MREKDNIKSNENHMYDPAYAGFFRWAKKNCCNYSAKGPGGRSHYCWDPPEIHQRQCIIPFGQQCPWFEKNVLPLNQKLLREWHRFREQTGDNRGQSEAMQERVCPCGTRLVPRSQRNIHCEECRAAPRWESHYRAQQKKRSLKRC